MSRQCPQCQGVLPPNAPRNKKFCSSTCKSKCNNAKAKARLVARRSSQVCECCLKKFSVDSLRKYCSVKCQTKVSRANTVARNQARLQSLTCERCGDNFSAARGGYGKRFGRRCPECKKIVDGNRKRRWRKRLMMDRRRKLLCTVCGDLAVKGKRCCQKHLDYCVQLTRKSRLRLAAEKGVLYYPLGDFIFHATPLKVSEGFEATGAAPGSEEKIAIFAERIEKGLPLFHDDDENWALTENLTGLTCTLDAVEEQEKRQEAEQSEDYTDVLDDDIFWEEVDHKVTAYATALS